MPGKFLYDSNGKISVGAEGELFSYGYPTFADAKNAAVYHFRERVESYRHSLRFYEKALENAMKEQEQ